MSNVNQGSRLEFVLEMDEFTEALASRLDDMANAGESLGPDGLRDLAARLRGEAISS